MTKLNKPTCIRCWNKFGEELNSMIGYECWTEQDDEEWKRGRVLCPKSHEAKTDSIPDHCPYSLEHLTQ